MSTRQDLCTFHLGSYVFGVEVALVQEVLNTGLSDRTVLTIAHRTETVMGCDRVLVMESGRVVEAGRPRELLEEEGSLFSKHVKSN